MSPFSPSPGRRAMEMLWKSRTTEHKPCRIQHLPEHGTPKVLNPASHADARLYHALLLYFSVIIF